MARTTTGAQTRTRPPPSRRRRQPPPPKPNARRSATAGPSPTAATTTTTRPRTDPMRQPQPRRRRSGTMTTPRSTKAAETRRRRSSSAVPPSSPVLLPIVLLLTLTFLSVLPVADATFSMIVESGAEECFVVRSPNQKGRLSTITGSYDSLDDDLSPAPLSVTLYDPRMRPVWKSRPSASEGRFSVVGQGRYQLCIGNGVDVGGGGGGGRNAGGSNPPAKPDGNDRNVGFSVRVRDLQKERERKMEELKAKAEGDKEGDDDNEQNSKSVKKAAETASLAEQLVERLDALKDHQSFLREREAMHRDVSEGTFGLLIRWTLAEAACLVIVAVGQVFYLRKFFETRRYL